MLYKWVVEVVCPIVPLRETVKIIFHSAAGGGPAGATQVRLAQEGRELPPQFEPASLGRPLTWVRLGGGERVWGSVEFTSSCSPGSLQGTPGLEWSALNSSILKNLFRRKLEVSSWKSLGYEVWSLTNYGSGINSWFPLNWGFTSIIRQYVGLDNFEWIFLAPPSPLQRWFFPFHCYFWGWPLHSGGALPTILNTGPLQASPVSSWMEILTAGTFLILTQPRCFSAWLIFRLVNILRSRLLTLPTTDPPVPSSPSLFSENELGSTFIFGKPSAFRQIKFVLLR